MILSRFWQRPEYEYTIPESITVFIEEQDGSGRIGLGKAGTLDPGPGGAGWEGMVGGRRLVGCPGSEIQRVICGKLGRNLASRIT